MVPLAETAALEVAVVMVAEAMAADTVDTVAVEGMFPQSLRGLLGVRLIA